LHVKNIFAQTNRGVLLDVVVFALNLMLMRLLTKYFIELVRLASADDSLAVFQLSLFFTGLLVLPATGAVLKRWHFHHRRNSRQKSRGKAQGQVATPEAMTWGCLSNPIFYFTVSLLISAAAVSLFGTLLFGRAFQSNGAIFVPFILGGLVLSVLQTFFVFHYFSPPKKAPSHKFLRDQRSALAGDACIYLNMILFQVLWNTVGLIPFGRVTSLGDLTARVFFLSFVALLIYFPPRIFYLAEDAHRPTVWLTMFLANSPVILRLLFGANLKVTG
jgi:hypothetical protein